jgi:ABC-type multidrug transport system fused ATPase/permease subunit
MVKSLLATLVKDLIMFLGVAVLLFLLNFRLALAVSAILPVIWIIARLFARQARDAFRELRRWVAQLNAVIQETINGMALIQLLRGEGRRYRVFQDANHQTYLAGMQQIQVFALFMPLLELGSAGVVGVLLWYGGGEILRGTLTLGALVAFLSYTQMFFRPLRELTEKYSVMQSAMASLERIFALMDEESEPDPPVPAAAPASGWSGEIVFDHVHFAYESDKWALRDISFTIPPGESVAVVGRSGGGKTTLMHLLAGFYPPGRGAIRIDGRDLQTLSKKELRSIIGLVPQEAFLFAGNLEDNLFPEAAAPAAAGSAGWPGASGIPERLRELFGREVRTLSAGEQQLAALARVMIRNPSILVLDEATAHVDAATESQVQETLRRLLAGRTSLVIAHRLFTLRQTRRILVLHEGRLVEDGTHEQLMALKGYYYRLYQLQFASVNGEGR